MDDAARGGHPLHVAGADDVAVSARVAVLHLALEGDGDGLESAVGMLPHAATLVRGLELFRGGVIEHQPGRELLGERAVVEHGEHVEAVAHPVTWRGAEHLANLLALGHVGVDGGGGGGAEGARESARSDRADGGDDGRTLGQGCQHLPCRARAARRGTQGGCIETTRRVIARFPSSAVTRFYTPACVGGKVERRFRKPRPDRTSLSARRRTRPFLQTQRRGNYIGASLTLDVNTIPAKRVHSSARRACADGFGARARREMARFSAR